MSLAAARLADVARAMAHETCASVSHHSVALHPGRRVDGVAKQTVARHLQTDHSGHHHPRVNT